MPSTASGCVVPGRVVTVDTLNWTASFTSELQRVRACVCFSGPSLTSVRFMPVILVDV